jgi:predicted dehydrogenase
MSETSSRRDFLKQGVAAGLVGIGAPTIIPSGVLAQPGRRIGANDRVILGGIGVGSRGGPVIASFAGMEDVAVAAVADVDLTRARQVGRNLEAEVYQDYRRLLERSDIDAVVIASPDHWHALHAIHAAQAGKDIYCEKSMSHTVREGRLMADAVKRYDRVFITGSQQRSQDRFYRVAMLVRNGYLGKITRVVGVNFAGPWENALPEERIPDGLDWDMWCGPVEPHPYNVNLQTSRAMPGWLSIRDFCGGEINGWGTHDLDQVQWALGMDESGPEEVWVEGDPYEPWVARTADRTGRFFGAKNPTIHYRYPGDIVVDLVEDRNPDGGGVFIGTNGRIRIERSTMEYSDPDLQNIPYEQMPIQLERSTNHNANFIESIRNRSLPITHVEIGHRSATVCHLGNIARWVSQKTGETGERLRWDPVAERFSNSEWANHFLDRPRREPWTLPTVV